MNKILLSALMCIATSASALAQSIYLCKNGDYTKQDITEGLDIDLTQGYDSITFAVPQMEKAVKITYNGATASVIIPSFITGVTCTSGTSADVVIASTNITDEITYMVSGKSDNGSLTISGDYKLTVDLDNVSLTSAKGGAVDIQCGKRINIALHGNNTFADAAGGTQKACFYTKGHIEFSQDGNISVSGNAAHAIAAKEYIEVKNKIGSINIVKAAKDAIHCGQYFDMKGGTINIDKNTMNDGIQTDIIYLEDGMTVDSEKEYNGQAFFRGGNVNITLAGEEDSKGIKVDGDITISGGTMNINANSNGSRGIQTDGNIVISEETAPTSITINAAGGKCTLAEDADDPHKCMGIKADGNVTINAGTITVYNTGSKSKGIKAGGLYVKNGGTVTASVEDTTGKK